MFDIIVNWNSIGCLSAHTGDAELPTLPEHAVTVSNIVGGTESRSKVIPPRGNIESER